MIEREEIDEMGATLGVHASDVQRDYVFGWLLATLYGEGLIPDGYVLKGGGCLRKGYFERTRFTRDLDFSMSGAARPDALEAALKTACRAILPRTGVRFDVDRTRVREKKRVSGDVSVYEAAVYFSDFYGKPNKMLIGASMDVTEFDRLHLGATDRRLLHPYSDAEECSALIRCARLEEVLASKLKCLLQRRKVADLYDLCHWIYFHPDEIDRGAVAGVFLRKTIYRPDPGAAGELLRNLAFDAFARAWETYISCATDVLMPFGDAVERFLDVVGGLFGKPRGWGRGMFFPSALRNPLLEAGGGPNLIRVIYKGVARIAEPYSLRFKHTRQGDAKEYLYVHEVSKNGRPTGETRTYVADPLQSVEVLDETFEPRWPVELSSAGEYGAKRNFNRGARLPRLLAPRGPRRRQGRARYKVRCAVCKKLFRRVAPGTKLRPHKDLRGNACYCRWGLYEGMG